MQNYILYLIVLVTLCFTTIEKNFYTFEKTIIYDQSDFINITITNTFNKDIYVQIFPEDKNIILNGTNPRISKMSNPTVVNNTLLQFKNVKEVEEYMKTSPHGFSIPSYRTRQLSQSDDVIISYAAKKTMETMKLLVSINEDFNNSNIEGLLNNSFYKAEILSTLSVVILEFAENTHYEVIKSTIRSLLTEYETIEMIYLNIKIRRATSIENCPSANLYSDIKLRHLYGSGYHTSVNSHRHWNENSNKGNSYQLYQSKITESWKYMGPFTEGLTVCVVDTGVDLYHIDLKDNIWINQHEKHGRTGFDDDRNGYIDDVYGINMIEKNLPPLDYTGHGTHCAGIIASNAKSNSGVIGGAPFVKILACKFLDDEGSGTLENSVRCLDYAIKNKVSIINASYGGDGGRIADNLYQKLLKHNILIVTAAGNDGINVDNTNMIPAKFGKQFDNVITVAAVNKFDKLAPYSNYGKKSVTLAAGGDHILSTFPRQTYGYSSGTSMAAPLVSAIAALIWNENPTLLATDVASIIKSSVNYKDYLNKHLITSGIANAEKAMQKVAGNKNIRPYPRWSHYRMPIYLAKNSKYIIPIKLYGHDVGDDSIVIKVNYLSAESKFIIKQDKFKIIGHVLEGQGLNSRLLPSIISIPAGYSKYSYPVNIRLVPLNRLGGYVGFYASSTDIRLSNKQLPNKNYFSAYTSIDINGLDIGVQCANGVQEFDNNYIYIYYKPINIDNTIEYKIKVICEQNNLKLAAKQLNNKVYDLRIKNECVSNSNNCDNNFKVSILAIPLAKGKLLKNTKLANIKDISNKMLGSYCGYTCNFDRMGDIEYDSTCAISKHVKGYKKTFTYLNFYMIIDLPFYINFKDMSSNKLYVNKMGFIAFDQQTHDVLAKNSYYQNTAKLKAYKFLAMYYGDINGKYVTYIVNNYFVIIEFIFQLSNNTQKEYKIYVYFFHTGDIVVHFINLPDNYSCVFGFFNGQEILKIPEYLSPNVIKSSLPLYFKRSENELYSMEVEVNGEASIKYDCNKQIGLLVLDYFKNPHFDWIDPADQLHICK